MVQIKSITKDFQHLLHIQLHDLNRRIFMTSRMADPDLQVISGGLGEWFAEPWRSVELTAGTGVCTSHKGSSGKKLVALLTIDEPWLPVSQK